MTSSRDGIAVADRPFDSKLRARRSAHRVNKLRVAGAAATGIGLVVLAAWLALGTNLLAVHRVTVTGASPMSAPEVRSITNSALGDPMLTIDTGALVGRLDAIPAVRAATVSRSWPRGLRVHITERVPVAIVGSRGDWKYVDATGTTFGVFTSRPTRIARLQVMDPRPSDASTRAGLAVLGSLPHRLRVRVREVDVPTIAGVELRLTHGVHVVWGGPDHARAKAVALAALVRRGPGVYDVSTPSVVTVQPH
jgi:cell division protein FtsQ